MSALQLLLAFVVAPLFFLAAAFKLGTVRRFPEQKNKLIRQVVLYGLAGVAWVVAAFCLRM
jgi:hypothetical protein